MTDRQDGRRVTDRLGRDSATRLAALRRRLWLRRSLRGGGWATAAALIALAGVQLLARSIAVEWAPQLMLAVVAAVILAWAAWSWLQRPSLVATAHRADDELALRERLGTALELIGSGGATERELELDLVPRQLADARARLAEVDLRGAFRPRLERRPASVAGIALVLLLVLVVWPNPQDGVLADRRAAREASRQVAERVEKVADDAERKGADTKDPERDKLVEQLRRLARQLREQGDDRQATLARIGSVQEQLAKLADPQAAARDAELTQLSRSISRAVTGDDQNNAEGTTDAAAKDLEDLANKLGSQSPSEARSTTDALRQASQAASGQPDLARQLSEAADALDRAAQSGDQHDQQAARDALNRAADATRNAEQRRQLQRDVAAAQSALSDGARQVARAGQPQPGSSGQPQPGASGQPAPGSPGQPSPGGSGQPAPGASGAPGQGNQPGQGTQPGQGNNTGNQPGGGGGTQVHRIPGGGLRTGSFNGPSQGNKPDAPNGDDKLFAPINRLGNPGDPSYIAGQGGNGGPTQNGGGNGIGLDNQSVVPYRSVFDLFRNFANNQLDRQQVPVTLKDFVRDYFSRLEPTEQP
ncbi:MAG TPA: hypothetical protein VFN14_01645 [Candidatus Limnocylindria bacterium]|nr:hypothetical protein [Candidatus Limnocylindria bacterium]